MQPEPLHAGSITRPPHRTMQRGNLERGTEEETEAEDALRRQRQREQAVDDLYARYRRGELDAGDYEAARNAVLSAGWSA